MAAQAAAAAAAAATTKNNKRGSSMDMYNQLMNNADSRGSSGANIATQGSEAKLTHSHMIDLQRMLSRGSSIVGLQEANDEDAEITDVFLVFTNYAQLENDQRWAQMLNYFIYCFFGHLTHVEPVFCLKGKKTGRRSTHSFNVKPGLGVRVLENKKYDWKVHGWHKSCLRCDSSQRELMYFFCLDQVGKRYDTNGFARYILPQRFHPPNTPGTTNCTRLTSEMLLEGFGTQQLTFMQPPLVTVLELYNLCKDNCLLAGNELKPTHRGEAAAAAATVTATATDYS